jgi:protein-tyrosine phosphatase
MGKGALFLGDVHSIEQRRLFTESSVKTVVCCIKDYSMKSFQSKFPNIQVACIPLKDKPEQDIVQYFEPAYHAIDKGRVRGNVLVFCFAGVSRSASIVLSYIMRENKLSYE